METFGTKFDKKIKEIFHCKNCDYSTSYKSEFDRHCSTRKHTDFQSRKLLETILPKKSRDIDEFGLKCLNCNREFETKSGLWKHTQKCTGGKHNDVVEILLKQNQEYKEMLCNIISKKDEDLKNVVVEICKNMQTNNCITNNINNSTNVNNNNTFNLNLFLNETCKDAMNLSDFIKGVKVSIDDIEHIGKVGYVDGLSDIIIKNLNELGIERRPIHCTDAKRQVVYVKEDNKWEKEDDAMTRLKKMVCGVQQANFITLKKWREIYPSCLTANSIYTDTYNTMSQELMGGDCEKISLAAKEMKIISKVARGMTIDKSTLALR